MSETFNRPATHPATAFQLSESGQQTGGTYIEYVRQHEHSESLDIEIDQHVLAINLSRNSSEIAYASDRFKRVHTPMNCAVFAPGSATVKERNVEGNNCEIVFLHIDQAVFTADAEGLSQTKNSLLNYRTDIVDPSLGALGREIRRYFLEGSIEGEEYLEHLSSALKLRTMHLLAQPGHSRGQNPMAHRFSPQHEAQLKELIDTQLASKLRVACIAKTVNMSETRFKQTFRRSFGVSCYQFILNERIARAQRLIRTSRASLSAIAHDCGFSSQAHMTLCFRNKFGLTPAQYRKSSA